MIERELTEPDTLTTPSGELNPRAVGWSRRPLLDASLPRSRWGRRKRWHHWAITSNSHVLTLTFADLDYLGLVTASLLDLASARFTDVSGARPFGFGEQLPPRADQGEVRAKALGLELHFETVGALTRLRAHSRRLEADLTVTRPPGHETLDVVVPWDARRFQLTSKQNTLPARGEVRLRTRGGIRTISFGPGSFATLDYGRGVWPYRTEWNWASASAEMGGHTVGFNLGARWTDGTGSTENALCLDGRLHKLSEDIRFDYDPRDFTGPWRLASTESDLVRLDFVPVALKRLRLPLGLAGAALHLCFGHFSGRIAGIGVDRMVGWAEELRARW